MKRILSFLLAAALCTACACSFVPKREEEPLFTYETSDPVIVETDGNVMTMNFFRDGLKIYGRIYLPSGDGVFPAVLLSQGMRANFATNKDIAEAFADAGFAAVIYEFIGGSDSGKSDGEAKDMSVLTEAADICAVMDEVKTLPMIDGGNIFLWGHSLGGLAATTAACVRKDEVRGLIAVEPSYQGRDQVPEIVGDVNNIPEIMYTPIFAGRAYFEDLLSYDVYELMPDYDGNVLMFKGTQEYTIGHDMPQYLDRAAQTFPSCETVTAEGADHAFSVPECRRMMTEKSIEFMRENVK